MRLKIAIQTIYSQMCKLRNVFAHLRKITRKLCCLQKKFHGQFQRCNNVVLGSTTAPIVCQWCAKLKHFCNEVQPSQATLQQIFMILSKIRGVKGGGKVGGGSVNRSCATRSEELVVFKQNFLVFSLNKVLKNDNLSNFKAVNFGMPEILI